MSDQQPYPNSQSQASDQAYQPVPKESGNKLAYVGLILGIVSLVAWFLPLILIGFPVAIAGIVVAIISLRSASRRTVATWALVLSIIGLVGTVINSALGAYYTLYH